MSSSFPVSKTKNVSMSDLTDKQAAFVRSFVEAGGKRGAATQAALEAGYANGDPVAARVRGSELLRNEKVLAALRDELTRKLNAAATLAVETLVELVETGTPSVRLQAAKELLDRGYGPIMSRNAHVVATTSVDDLVRRLAESDEEWGASDEEIGAGAKGWGYSSTPGG